MATSGKDRDIVIALIKTFKDIDISTHKIKNLAKAVCNRFARDELQDTRYEINIAIVDDNQILELNKQFLNNKDATDC